MSVLSAFNTQCYNFISELSDMYPDDKDLSLGKTSIYLLKKTNPRKLHVLFREYMYEYKEKVFQKDASFFLEKKETEYRVIDDNYFSTIMNLKKYWKELSEESQENMWKYLIVLFKLSDKICN